MENVFIDGMTDTDPTTPMTTAEGYAQLVRRSNLVDGHDLDDALQRFQNLPKKKGRNEAEGLAFFLLQLKLLTPWQTKMLLLGRWRGFVLGKYRLLDRIGSGGMSSVYLAEHQLMKRQVAIKVLPRSQAEKDSRLHRFIAESRAVAQLDHPNIVRAFHLDVEYDRYYLVMEYIEGMNLQQKVEREGPLPFNTAADFVIMAARGLAHAHQAGLIHRDVKPANLLVDRNNIVKLLDLGLARSMAPDATSLTNDRSGKVLGTADYVAPEQVKDSHDVDERTDLYGLGCTFYYLLTGQAPFAEGNLAQKLAMHLYHQPTSIRELRPDAPLALVRVCHKMMAKKREDRYQTAMEVVDILNDFLDDYHANGSDTSADGGQDDDPPVMVETKVERPRPTVNAPRSDTSLSIDMPKPTGLMIKAEAEEEAAAAELKPPVRKKRSSSRAGESTDGTRRRRKKSKRKRSKSAGVVWPDVLTLEETSRYLRLPKESIQRLVTENRIPCQQILGEYRFHRQAVDAWLQTANFSSTTWAGARAPADPMSGPASANGAGPGSVLWQRQGPDVATLAKQIRHHRILTAEAEKQLQQQLDEGSLPDGDAVLVWLRQQGSLTDYQTALLRQGRKTGLRYGDYLVLERIGSGGMAVVYKARHEASGRIVAVKVLQRTANTNRAEDAERFDREVRAVAKLNHKNIVTAYDAVHTEHESYLVLEYVDGQNLDQRIRREGRLGVPEAVDYILQTARGLQHAHSKHLVHRDVKPGNLLLDKRGTVKILDLGLVRFEQSLWSGLQGDQDRLTKSETVLGTPDFMAPEQFVDARQADNRADIYSLGCTLYFLLSGRSPYECDSPTRTLKAHQTEPIPSLREVCPEAPLALQLIFEKMMAKEPRHRYQSMDEIIADIEHHVSQHVGVNPASEATERPTLHGGALTVNGTPKPTIHGQSKSALSGKPPGKPVAVSPATMKSNRVVRTKTKKSAASWRLLATGVGFGAFIGGLMGLGSALAELPLAMQFANLAYHLAPSLALPAVVSLTGVGMLFCGGLGFIVAALQGE